MLCHEVIVLVTFAGGARSGASSNDEEQSEKVFKSIRKQGGVGRKHQQSLVELLRRAGHRDVQSATVRGGVRTAPLVPGARRARRMVSLLRPASQVLGWKHAVQPVDETARAKKAYERSVSRLSGGNRQMSWRGLDFHTENLTRMRNALTVTGARERAVGKPEAREGLR